MEKIEIFYLYREISSINYENIIVQFFTISFGNERLGGELTAKFCCAMQTCFKTLTKSSDNSTFVHLSSQVGYVQTKLFYLKYLKINCGL